jgi:hypothetical protein
MKLLATGPINFGLPEKTIPITFVAHSSGKNNLRS